MDPIADFLTSIRNAYMAGKQQISCPNSKIKKEIAKVLKQEGFIKDFEVVKKNNHQYINLTLVYLSSGEPVLTKIDRVSRPSVRVYAGKDKLPYVLSGKGIAIITTPQGVMTESQARALGLGGEIICTVN